MQGMIGKTVGRYRITEHLGRGGMAEVYKAYQPSLDRYVAIKLMHSFLADDKDFLTRFEREAKVVATLRHPNIVQVYDFDVESGQYYMVMEFIDGVTLKAMLEALHERGEWLPLSDSVNTILSVGLALQYAHERSMVHRDVKPANVMIAKDGHVILTDFGIAKIMSATNLTASGAMVGTPSYMSPEQGMGQAGDDRSDIYSLGVMLYQLSVGRLPYDADTPLAVVLKHINDPLPMPRTIKPDLPEGVEQVILKALAKSPDDRYPNVGDLMADLRRAVGLPADVIADSKSGSVIRLSGATVVGRIGASTPPPAGTAAGGSTVARAGSAHTVARGAAVPGSAETVVRPEAPPQAGGRPKWLIPVLVIAAVVVLGGGGVLLATSSQPPAPTATPALTPSPTVVPSPTSFTPPEATLNRDNVECRSGPGANAPVSGTINRDVGEFLVTARSGDMLKILLTGDVSCWVAATAVDLGGVDIGSIPSAAVLATLTPTPSITPTGTPADTPTDTPTATLAPTNTRPPATRPPPSPTRPTAAPATATPSPTTAGAALPISVGWQRLGDAVRSGDDWVETVRIDPSGGDGIYVVFYQDTQVFGPPFFITIRSRGNIDGSGCKNLPTSVRVGSAGQSVIQNMFFDPPGGCDGWWP